MGVIAITMFLGISFLTTHIDGITVSEPSARWSRRSASAVFGEGSVAFYVVQGFTAAILILAANTAYQDFPRLASILARDRFMPLAVHEPRRPVGLLQRGDRSRGSLDRRDLAFDANLTKLIQMYVVGVFTSFTLSQTGMVRHWSPSD